MSGRTAAPARPGRVAASVLRRLERRRARRLRRLATTAALAVIRPAVSVTAVAVTPERPARRRGIMTVLAGGVASVAALAILVIPLLQTPEAAVAQQPTPIASVSEVSSPLPSASASTSDPASDKEKASKKTKAAPAPPDPPNWPLAGLFFGLVFVLTLLNAAFSMSETALVSVRRSRVEQLIEEGQRGAKTVRRLIENPPRFIATVQVGITLLGFASAAAAATTLAAPLTYALYHAGLSPSVAQTIAIGIITILIAIFSMVVGEIAPKSLAVQAPDRWALRLAPFVDVCATLFTPITSFVVAASNVLVRPFGAKAQFETPIVTKEELEHIIGEGAESGELDREEQEILENVFDFSETLVRSVMTPRIDMTALPLTADLAQTLETVFSSGHSRIPVYEGTIDNVVGIVHAKDLLRALQSDNKMLDLRQVVRPAHFVPETRRVADLLAEMRRSNQQLAIVQDEYAGTEGLVTIEDLLEEIVGDIRDEYDVDEPEVQVLSSTESIVDGRMSIDDVNDRLGIELPHDDYETIGGLVFGMLGHEPTPGERVRVDGHEFIVEMMEGRRIKTIRALRIPEGSTSPEGAGEASEPSDADVAVGA